MKNCTPLWREANVQVKMCNTHQVQTTFGSWDVEKVHAVAARSTFPSENVQNTWGSDQFLAFKCRSAWQAQWIVDLSKSEQNVRVLRQFHIQLQLQLHNTTLHYATLPCTTSHYNAQHATTLHPTTLHYTALHYTHYNTLHYATLHYTTVRYSTLH